MSKTYRLSTHEAGMLNAAYSRGAADYLGRTERAPRDRDYPHNYRCAYRQGWHDARRGEGRAVASATFGARP